MPKIHEKIMQVNFAKSLKKLVLIFVCVSLLGGGLSAAMLRPQIKEGIKNVHEWERDDGHDFFDEEMIPRPAAAALITVGITGLLLSVFLFLFWVLVAAWLYQAAVLSDMNGLLWMIAGLVGNIFAVAAFLAVRSIIRTKCPSCGNFQPVKTLFCEKCGSAIYKICVSCGASCGTNDKFCSTCGEKLHKKEQQNGGALA